MKCYAIFIFTFLVVLLAEASAAPPRYRQLIKRRSHERVRLFPKYALRRSWQENPDCTPSSVDVIVADDPQIGTVDAAAPLISEDPSINELDAPIINSQEVVPEPAVAPAAIPTAPAAEEEADEEDDFVPATKSGKRPAHSWPHTFFPMNFGRTSGGSIAVANSFSTGKGNAMSHAIAYGGGKPNREV